MEVELAVLFEYLGFCQFMLRRCESCSAFCILQITSSDFLLTTFIPIRFPPTDNVPNKGTEKFNV